VTEETKSWLAKLAVNVPVGFALLVMAGMFIEYSGQERAEWRATLTESLNANTDAMRTQLETLIRLVTVMEKHDEFTRDALRRLESAK
jgi:hypothetical protein